MSRQSLSPNPYWYPIRKNCDLRKLKPEGLDYAELELTLSEYYACLIMNSSFSPNIQYFGNIVSTSLRQDCRPPVILKTECFASLLSLEL